MVSVPASSADAVGAGAELVDGGLGGRVDARVADQAQVAVRGVHAHLPPIDDDARPAFDLLDRLVVEIQVILAQAFISRSVKNWMRRVTASSVVWISMTAPVLEKSA